MNRIRLVSVLAPLLLLLVLLSGCDELLSGEYRRIYPHLDQRPLSEERTEWQASDLSELKSALQVLIDSRGETVRIKLVQYTTSVGTIEDEISRAGFDVMKGHPVAAYTVDYISQEYMPLSNEVTYTVYYIADRDMPIHRAADLTELADSLEQALGSNAPKIALSMYYDVIAGADLNALIREVYYRSPAQAVGMPSISYSLYPPDQGIRCVVELAITYPHDREETQNRIRAVVSERDSLLGELDPDLEPPYRALAVYDLLCGAVTFDEETRDEENGDEGNNLYSALVGKKCGAAGFALAYMQLCIRSGIECRLVIGMRANSVHFWNIIRLDGDWYHVDVAADAQAGGAHDWFLMTDDEMSEIARWDTDNTPKCTAKRYTYAELVLEPGDDDSQESPPVVTAPPETAPPETPTADPEPDETPSPLPQPS